MAKKAAKEPEISLTSDEPGAVRPRLRKLRVRNFCCIGSEAVEIELDDIVVLVGPNNTGKSSILRAYEIVMSHGSAKGKLAIADFPEGKVRPESQPEIELETTLYDENRLGEQWILTDQRNGERYVRERWTWAQPGEPKRQGFNGQTNEWDDGVPWGAPNIAKEKRPEPHRVDAFASPDTQAQEITSLLAAVLKERVKEYQATKGNGEDGKSDYELLLALLRQVRWVLKLEAVVAFRAVQVPGFVENLQQPTAHFR